MYYLDNVHNNYYPVYETVFKYVLENGAEDVINFHISINSLRTLFDKLYTNKSINKKGRNRIFYSLVTNYYRYIDDGITSSPYWKPRLWDTVSMYAKLNKESGCLEFFSKYKQYINWDLLSRYNDLECDKFYDAFKHDLDWTAVCKYQILSEEQIEKYIHFINLDIIVLNSTFSEAFLTKHADKFEDLNNVLISQIVSEQFIERFLNRLSWNNISLRDSFSTEFLDKYAEQLNWWYLSYEKNVLTKQQIWKYHNYLQWKGICTCYELDEGTMIMFNTFLNWEAVSEYQRIEKSVL